MIGVPPSRRCSTFKNLMDRDKDEAKTIFWMSYLFGKTPIEILRQDEFEYEIDRVIFNAGFRDWCRTMASFSGIKVD